MDGIVVRPSRGFVKSFFFFCELLMELRGALGVHDRTVSKCLRMMAVLQDASSRCSTTCAELRDAEEAETKAKAEAEYAADELHALTWCARENTRTLLAHIDAKPSVRDSDKEQARDAWETASGFRSTSGKDLGWYDEPEAIDTVPALDVAPAEPAARGLLAHAHRFVSLDIMSVRYRDTPGSEGAPR